MRVTGTPWLQNGTRRSNLKPISTKSGRSILIRHHVSRGAVVSKSVTLSNVVIFRKENVQKHSSIKFTTRTYTMFDQYESKNTNSYLVEKCW